MRNRATDSGVSIIIATRKASLVVSTHSECSANANANAIINSQLTRGNPRQLSLGDAWNTLSR